MVFKLLIAPNTAEVRLEVEAAALALVGSDRRVFLMRVLTNTAGTPRVHIETLSARQVPLSKLLGPPRNKPEGLALAGLAI